MQNNISKQKLIAYLNTYSNGSDFDDSNPLELISAALDISIGHVSQQTVNHIAFVVLASFNLAKASELIDNVNI